MIKSKLVRKGFVSLYKVKSITEESHHRSSNRNLEVGTEAETLQEHKFLACFQAHVSDLYYIDQA